LSPERRIWNSVTGQITRKTKRRKKKRTDSSPKRSVQKVYKIIRRKGSKRKTYPLRDRLGHH